VPHNCEWGTFAEIHDKLVQVSNVASYGERLASATSLPRLYRAEEL
jgi:hypothetical protein